MITGIFTRTGLFLTFQMVSFSFVTLYLKQFEEGRICP